MDKFDVVVISGSSAGVGAALAAGRMGARVALVEDTPVLGGMLANGISNIDTFSLESLSGIFEEFRQAVKQHYRPESSSDPVFEYDARPAPHVDGRSRQSNDPREGGRWEPHVADRIFKNMAAATSTLEIFYNRFPVEVVKRANRIVGVVTERSAGPHAYAERVEGDQLTFYGDVIVDATHEGDIAAWAGAPYRVGREARSRVEPHAGDITFFNDTGEIMNGSGRQDGALVSFGVRVTAKTYPESTGDGHLLDPPPGYDPDKYEPASNYVTAAGTPRASMPNGKCVINANPIGNELQEVNWSWADADRVERATLYETYREHALGFVHYLQQAEGTRRLGLADDEFVDNDSVPYRLFVREARRIEGEHVMTEADVNSFVRSNSLLPPLRHDSIAVGHYPIDSKPVRPKTDLSTPDKGAGDFFLINGSVPFQVPYGSIVPKSVDGLLVPAAMSATHVAFSAIRMDPTWVAMGQAAGIAAVLSIRARVPVREVPVRLIQHELLVQGAKLMFYWDLPVDHVAFKAVQWLSVRGVVTGYPDRYFRPDQQLTRAELAAMLFHGLDIWPSISEIHFTDLPFDHWAFRYIETLFDNQALEPFGVKPLWPEASSYDPTRHAGFKNAEHDRFGMILPDDPVTWNQALRVLRKLTKILPELVELAEMPDTDLRGGEFVTRGAFSAVLARLLGGSSLFHQD